MDPIETRPLESSPSKVETSELQEVLTRYIDSRDGYLQAADLAEDTGLSSAFSVIAQRREKIAVRLVSLIRHEGSDADTEGSPEAGIHRWWIRLKERFSSHESAAIIRECLRGEQELARTLTAAIDEGHLDPAHESLIRDALSEVQLAVAAFENVIEKP